MNRTSAWMRRFLAVGVVGVLIGAVFGAGCGGGTSSADKTATAVAKSASATAAATKPPAATSTPAPAATSTKAPAATSTTAATSTPGAATTTVKIANVASIGNILADPNGMTLYTFKNDVPNSGQSSVPANIAPNWPPLIAAGALVAPPDLPGQLGSFARPDGSMQVMYKGMPLYLFVGDTKPGDANGQGLLGLWYAATP